MASLICFKVIILKFLHVIYWLNSLRFMVKQLSPFFLGIMKGYDKESLVPWPNSMVPSDSIELTSEVIMLT